MPPAISTLLTELFNVTELALIVRACPGSHELVNTVTWTGSFLDTCQQLVEAFERRGELDEFKALLLQERPHRAAEIHRIFDAHPRGPTRAAGGDPEPPPPANRVDLHGYYSVEEIDRRARLAFDDPGMLLVRDSQDWAALKGFLLPPIVERTHLAAREVFGAAEMAILLLLRPPQLQVLGERARLEVDLRGQSYGLYNNQGKKFLSEH